MEKIILLLKMYIEDIIIQDHKENKRIREIKENK